MAKNEPTPSTLHVKWEISGDGLRPTEAPWGFIVRNPVSLAVPPTMKATIRTNVASNYPMLAFPSRSHAEDIKVPNLIYPGQEVVVEITNTSKHMTLIVEDKEALVNLHPLVMSNVTSEVG